MLRQETVIDRIEVLEDGEIRVRHARRIFDGDALIAETYHRDAPLEPDAAVLPTLTGRARMVAEAIWTPDVIAAKVAKKVALIERHRELRGGLRQDG